MKKLLSLICIAGLSMPALAASHSEKLRNRLDASQTVIEQIMSIPDKAVPNEIASKATCVGVIPGVLKGAFIFGGEYGQGVVTCRTGHGWSAPVFIRLAGGSFGFQIGGQGTDLVLVSVNRKGFDDLLRDKIKIGVDASAAAGPVGRDAQASTDLQLKAELLTWSRSRGLFAGIDLNGAVVSQNSDDTERLYGSRHSFERILNGEVVPPVVAEPFLKAVAQYFGAAVAAQ